MSKVLLCLSIFFAVFAGAQPVKGPVLQSVSGDVKVETGRDPETRARDRMLLKEQARLVTGPGARVEIVLDKERTVRVDEKTEIVLPHISWETGEASRIELRRGRLRWTGTASEVKLLSPLFELSPPSADFVLSYDDQSPQAKILVLKGTVEFRALNAEDRLNLKAAETASFQGLFEEGEIAYDLLLKGRKIPRGKLSAVMKASAAEMKPYLEEEKIRKAAAVKAAQAKARQKAELDRAGVVCAQPRGLLNECEWTLKNGRCIRRRCNANGQWAEESVLLGEAARKCSKRPVIERCDY